MKHKARTKAMSWLLSLALALSLVPGMGLTAQAALPDKVYYRVYDYSDSKLTYTDYEIAGTGATEVTSDTTEWANGTYVVSATTTISSRITVTGTVNLIIFDGATLTAEKGITVSDGNTLNIYMGSSSNSIQSTGQLNATALKDDVHRTSYLGAGIGGYCEQSMSPDGTSNFQKSGCGNINIHGGSIRVQYNVYNDSVAGIGGSLNGAGGNITIYYGSVTAYSNQYASAIGDGNSGSGGNIAVYGGEVNAIVADAKSNSKNGFGGTLTVGKDVQVYALQGSKSPNEDLSGQTNVAPEGGGQVTTFNNSMFTRYTGPAPVSSHEHNFTYSASGDTITATCGADGCTLPEVGGKHTAKLTIKPPANLVYDNKAKAATVEGTIPDVETPSIKYIGRGDTTYESTDAPTEMGNYTASITLSADITGGDPVTASVDFTIKDASYTITIPATLKVADAGWNDAGGITAKGEIAEDKKLTVTATSANEWKLTKTGQQETIAYKLAESGDSTTTYAGATEKTVWDFSVDELAKQGGTNKTMGAVVEEYINKPAGDYADTVTFTAEIRSLLNTITIDGTELIYADGDTWAQIVERNPEKIRIAGSSNNLIWRAQDNPLYIDGRTPVRPTDTIDPSLQYGFVAD